MDGVRFTIATVTFNAGTSVERTLRSVGEQDYGEIEHLIIDGRSTDGSLDLLRTYADRNPKARLLSEADHGLYDAMNKAIALATGDYLLFLNAGDCLHAKSTLSEIAALIGNMREAERPGVIYGDTHVVDGEGRFVRRRRLSPPKRLTWRSFKRGMLVCHQAFLVRSDIARTESYDLDYKLSADFDWCVRVLKECERRGLQPLNSAMVIADFMEGGLSTKRHWASLRERFRVMRRHYGLVTTVGMHFYFLLRAVRKR